jgi:hypothetical protein
LLKSCKYTYVSTPEIPDPEQQNPYRSPVPVEVPVSPEELAARERRRKEERLLLGLAITWTTWQAIWDLFINRQ